jgi:hypothetical protein
MSTYGNNTYGASYYGTDAVFNVSVSEAGSLADTVGVQRFVNASITETATATDAPGDRLIANVSVIEASTFGTSAYGIADYGKNANAVDIVAAQAQFISSVNETGALADSVVGNANFVAGMSVNEAASGADLPSATAQYHLSVSEAGTLTDAPFGPTNFVAGLSLIEGGSFYGAGGYGGGLYAAAISDAADITHYTQAPLPISARRNKTHLRR